MRNDPVLGRTPGDDRNAPRIPQTFME
jgi:hypothetical protein